MKISSQPSLHFQLLATFVAFALMVVIVVDGKISSLAAFAADTSERTIDFQSDQSLGSLTLVPVGLPHAIPNQKARQNVGAAIGKMTVHVPPGMMLSFEPNRRVLDQPERLEKITPDALDMLCISASAMDDAENERCNVALGHANHFKHLQELVVDRSDVTDAGLMKIRNLNSLEGISAMLCNVEGKCFQNLAKLPKLKSLNLWGSRINESSYKDLSLIKNLTYLNVNQTHLSAESVRQIARCSNLKKLLMAYDSTMVSAFVKYLVPLAQLEILDLRQTSVDDAALPDLAKMKSLKNLDLRRTGVTTTGLLALKPLHLDLLRLSDRSYSELQLKQIHSVCKIAILLPDAAKPVDKDTLRTFAPVTRHGE